MSSSSSNVMNPGPSSRCWDPPTPPSPMPISRLREDEIMNGLPFEAQQLLYWYKRKMSELEVSNMELRDLLENEQQENTELHAHISAYGQTELELRDDHLIPGGKSSNFQSGSRLLASSETQRKETKLTNSVEDQTAAKQLTTEFHQESEKVSSGKRLNPESTTALLVIHELKKASGFSEEMPERNDPILWSAYSQRLTNHVYGLKEELSAKRQILNQFRESIDFHDAVWFGSPPPETEPLPTFTFPPSNSTPANSFRSLSPPHLTPFDEDDVIMHGDVTTLILDENPSPVENQSQNEALKQLEQSRPQRASTRATKAPSLYSSSNYAQNSRISTNPSNKKESIPKDVREISRLKKIVRGESKAEKKVQESRTYDSSSRMECKFQCLKCPNRFLYLSDMKKHLKTTHKIANHFKNLLGCRFCGEMFTSRTLLYSHHTKIHKCIKKPPTSRTKVAAIKVPSRASVRPAQNPIQAVRAPVSGSTSKKRPSVASVKPKAKHSFNDQYPNKFGCVCGTSFQSRTALQWHVRTHQFGNMFRCLYCLETLLTPTNVKCHVKSRHVKFMNKPLRYRCALCPEQVKFEYDSMKDMEEHCEEAHDRIEFEFV